MPKMKCPEGLPVAEFEGFGLYRRPSGNEWESWRLFKIGATKKPRPGSKLKFSFWLGCDGKRLAATTDTKLLREHYPDMAEWAERTMIANYIHV